MDPRDTAFPTPEEIDALVRAGHRLRAETVAVWIRSAARWFSHPRLALRRA